VTREVARRLTDARSIHAAAAHVINPQARQAYLRGRFHLQKLTREADEKAVEYFNEAIAACSTIHWLRPMPRWVGSSLCTTGIGGEAEQEFRRAVMLDPNSADAHRGYSQYFAVTGQTEAAARESRIANTLDPSERNGSMELLCYSPL